MQSKKMLIQHTFKRPNWNSGFFQTFRVRENGPVSRNPLTSANFIKSTGGKKGLEGGGGRGCEGGGLYHACFSTEIFEPVPNNEPITFDKCMLSLVGFYPF